MVRKRRIHPLPLALLGLAITASGLSMGAEDDEEALWAEQFRPGSRGAPDSRVGAGTRGQPEIEMPDAELKLMAPAERPAAPPQAKPVPPPGPVALENALELDSIQRETVQRALLQKGFDPLGIDGLFGPNTRHAIARFQQANGFEATGFLTAEQLELLLAE